MPDTEPILWYAMRATYGRNQEAKKRLDEKGVESFIPMRYVVTIDRKGRKVKKLVPVVRDLVFVRTDRSSMLLLKEQLNDVLRTLTPREAKVLALRFGLEDGRPRTLEEVGKEFDITRERIRQIEAKALRKLRHPSRARHLRGFLD